MKFPKELKNLAPYIKKLNFTPRISYIQKIILTKILDDYLLIGLVESEEFHEILIKKSELDDFLNSNSGLITQNIKPWTKVKIILGKRQIQAQVENITFGLNNQIIIRVRDE